MALYLTKHSIGPELPECFKERKFRSYVDMANFADKHGLPDGIYWCQNTNGTKKRGASREGTGFRVYGRGNV